MRVRRDEALQAYNRVSLETRVASADPHQLILMLFEGARLAVALAKSHMARGDIAAKGQAISKAISIIDEGLKASLDVEAGGLMAERLFELYDYMSRRLVAANLENRPDLLDEVAGLLGELHGAWSRMEQSAGPAAG
jgi:flagellar secretion chaperone FliS